MSIHVPTPVYPHIIDHRRFVRNGTIVQSVFHHRIARAQNHIVWGRRKTVGSFSQDWASAIGSNLATTIYWRGYCHIGHGAEFLEATMIVLKADDASATSPLVGIATVNATTGISIASTSVHYGAIDDSTGDVPNDLAVVTVRVPVTGDTSYAYVIQAYAYARILSCEVHEVGKNPVNTTDVGPVDPNFEANGPIFALGHDQILAGQGGLLESNRPHLVSWSDVNGFNRVGGAVYENILDASAAPAADTLGFNVETEYHNTASRTTVPVIAACYADTGLNDGFVKFDNGAGDTVVITCTGNVSPRWFFQAGTIPAGSATKYDILARAGGAAEDIDVYAVALFEFE